MTVRSETAPGDVPSTPRLPPPKVRAIADSRLNVGGGAPSSAGGTVYAAVGLLALGWSGQDPPGRLALRSTLVCPVPMVVLVDHLRLIEEGDDPGAGRPERARCRLPCGTCQEGDAPRIPCPSIVDQHRDAPVDRLRQLRVARLRKVGHVSVFGFKRAKSAGVSVKCRSVSAGILTSEEDEVCGRSRVDPAIVRRQNRMHHGRPGRRTPRSRMSRARPSAPMDKVPEEELGGVIRSNARRKDHADATCEPSDRAHELGEYRVGVDVAASSERIRPVSRSRWLSPSDRRRAPWNEPHRGGSFFEAQRSSASARRRSSRLAMAGLRSAKNSCSWSLTAPRAGSRARRRTRRARRRPETRVASGRSVLVSVRSMSSRVAADTRRGLRQVERMVAVVTAGDPWALGMTNAAHQASARSLARRWTAEPRRRRARRLRGDARCRVLGQRPERASLARAGHRASAAPRRARAACPLPAC